MSVDGIESWIENRAMEFIQDFLNCDPMDIGKLQANTYDTIFNIEKEINNED